MMEVKPPELSVIIPIYNSANIFPELYKRLVDALEQFSISFEIIAVLDGCKDRSFEVISSFASKDNRLKVIEFSRNFGHQSAITAGLDFVSGEMTAIIDDDLEDPPELLPLFVARIKEGFDVVYGVRRKRKRSFVMRIMYRMFYRILGNLVDIKIPYDAGDFCVITKRVSMVLRSMHENNRYLRGMRAWSGFAQTGYEYDREPRFADDSGYSLGKYFKLATDAIFSFSYKPLKYVTIFGVGIAVLSFTVAFYIIYLKLAGRIDDFPGWASLFVSTLFLSGIQLISMGIIGEYIARIYDELKQRPKYVVKNLIGL